MRRTVKATIGVSTVAGALALGGGTALACFTGPSLTSPTGATSADDEMAPTTSQTQKSDDQSSTNQLSITDEDGTTKTVGFPEQASTASKSGAMTEERQESSTAQKNEAEDNDETNEAPKAAPGGDRDDMNHGRHIGWSHAGHAGARADRDGR